MAQRKIVASPDLGRYNRCRLKYSAAAPRFSAASQQGIPMPAYRSRTTTHGRNMAGARGLWR
ncbi:hypothetical protein, partial [Mesorhizobium sp.]|uniref:hypothetical protein n=1 Tax=Mesorhizobium sp. TaxID=1871066 RepID=UPI0025BB8A83